MQLEIERQALRKEKDHGVARAAASRSNSELADLQGEILRA